MDMDIVGRINAVHRELGTRNIPAGEGKVVVLRRSYDADIEDVWDACTDPERIARWFLPVTGDLKLGGTYQLKGNAGGEIVGCEPPRLLKVTWVYGENATEKDVGEVTVRLSPGEDGATVLELEHAAVVDPGFWGEFGPGAVGVGWDGALLGLDVYLGGGTLDGEAWPTSPEGREFATRSSEAWGVAHAASGAPADEVAAAVENTTKAYAPPPA
ncbi:SRPBCC family protein [Streptomyces sp. NPDC020898]|uniref:SRPBCC family protein n=1 Tax=Streptomyces sp. NPDC020898 TaxID=3365101 RepID=UPI00378FF1CF